MFLELEKSVTFEYFGVWHDDKRKHKRIDFIKI
jgi:hypothetical protein